MSDFFGIKNGYVFDFLKHGYNKTNTRDIIFEATGIDIYKNPDYEMSQERCIRKIWAECDDYTVGKLLKLMLDYYVVVSDWDWSSKENYDFNYLRELEKKLMRNTISIPVIGGDTITMVKEDIERNCNNNMPELALDRIHTFSTEFFRNICKKHGISIEDRNGNKFSLQSLVGGLRKWYEDNAYFESEFTGVAIRNAISIFEKFNSVRNNQSATHPNKLLNKAESMYTVKIISETVTFIDKIEQIKNTKTDQINSFYDDGIPF